jgi:dipeptidyl-peptidase-4
MLFPLEDGMSLVLTLALLAAPPATPKPVEGPPALTLERIFSGPPLEGALPREVAWLPDGRRFSYLEKAGEGKDARNVLWVEDAETGARESVLAEGDLEPVGEGDAAVAPRLAGYRWSPRGDSLLLSGGDDLFLVETAGRTTRRLTTGTEEERSPAFSPDGSKIAFGRANDLFVLDLSTGAETRVTADGSPDRFNGVFDWVYEEELAGRDTRAFAWSPDSRALVFLSLDESRVPRFPHVELLELHPTVEEQRYPRAGDPNPVPTLHVAEFDAAGAGVRIRRIALPEGRFEYVPRLGWVPGSRSVWFQLLDRQQTRLELVRYDLDGDAAVTLLVDEDPAWINLHDDLRFLADGSFLWSSEKTGFRHLALHDASGKQVRQLTSGSWEVLSLQAVDEDAGVVTFEANEASALGRGVYRVGLDGKGFSRVTHGAGVHRATVSPDGRWAVDSYSELTRPPVVRLVAADGRIHRVLAANEHPEIEKYRTSRPELVRIPGPWGKELMGVVTKPLDFQPGTRYPVVVYVYAGPHSQAVLNGWPGRSGLIAQVLAAHGFVTFAVDGRGTAGRGRDFERALLRRFGKVELEDQLAGIAWLKKQKYVDPQRIGIWGGSYGGFMTIYAMANAPGVFRSGVAVASVTDWRLYDSIYTERYLKLPADNPEGYRDSSPVHQAGKLGGRLLLIHGTSDDNVHWHNTLMMADQLVRAGKDYELQLYAGATHRSYRPDQRADEYRRMLDFFERTLR